MLDIQDKISHIDGNLRNLHHGMCLLNRSVDDRLTLQFLDQLKENVFSWLSGFDPSRMHDTLLRKAEPTTGQWFLNSKHIAEWKAVASSLLWLYGIRKATLMRVITY